MGRAPGQRRFLGARARRARPAGLDSRARPGLGAGNHPDRMMPGVSRVATVTIDDYWLNAQGWSHG